MIRESLGGVPYYARRPSNNSGGRIQSLLAFLALAFCALLMPNLAFADMPPAGAVIGNQATATYTDGNNNPRTTTSNLVNTSIVQVAGVDLQDDRNKTATPGATVYLPHLVKNTGNGHDSYDLTVDQAGGGGFVFTAPYKIYEDKNGDGVPDDLNNPVTNTGDIAPGASKNYVIAVVVPTTATSGQTSTVTVTAKSVFDPNIKDVNNDTVTVTQNAVVPVTKALSAQSGPAGTSVVTITLSYTNNGSNTAKDVTLTDNLDARYAYNANSGLWSVGQPAALTDASDGNEPGANSGIEYSAVGQLVTAKIKQVLPGQSGFVKFKVTVVSTASGTIPNQAGETYDDGSGKTITDTSNPAPFTVDPKVGVTLSDVGSTTTSPNDGHDTDGTPNQTVTRPSVPQGSTVYFDNVLTNTGNGTDTFDVTFDKAGSNFPAGTSFQLLRADGTPMTDSNGNGIQDTGPIASGAVFHVILSATLPPNATGGAGPYKIVKTATSATDKTKQATVTDSLTDINGSSVDVTNNKSITNGAAAADGKGVTTNGEAAPVTMKTVNPGETAKFDLWINNTSTVADSYNLLASIDNTFATVNPPAGWTVTFRNTATNAVISNTGTIVAGGSLEVTAEVTVPANAKPIAAPGQSIYFRAQSPTSGAKDVKNDSVIVNAVTDVSIIPNNNGFTSPNSTIFYKHTLTNVGNVDVTAGPITIADDGVNGWKSTLYYDKNGDGVFDPATEGTPITNFNQLPTMKPGDSLPLIVKVFAPDGLVDGASNTTTITIKANNDGNVANDVATDTTSIRAGNVQLIKTQANDANCDGTAEGAFVQTQLTAKPGQCLIYTITLTNLGSGSISGTMISDTTPSFSTYRASSVKVTPVGSPTTTPAGGTAGTVSTTLGTVAPNGTGSLTFGVTIDQ